MLTSNKKLETSNVITYLKKDTSINKEKKISDAHNRKLTDN